MGRGKAWWWCWLGWGIRGARIFAGSRYHAVSAGAIAGAAAHAGLVGVGVRCGRKGRGWAGVVWRRAARAGAARYVWWWDGREGRECGLFAACADGDRKSVV